MTNAELFFLQLLKCGTWNNKENTYTGSLDEIEQMAVNHLCVPLVYQGALNIGLSGNEKWKMSVLKMILHNEKNLRVQHNAIQKLRNANIPCAILKGSSVAILYATPSLRPLGDIDILVRECDYEKAIALFDDGTNQETAPDHKFHCKLIVDGMSVEIHKYVTEYTSDSYGKKIARFMKDALDCVETKEYEGVSFPALQPKYQAATLLLHTQRHFLENRLTMRMLCDWAVFIESVSREAWEKEIKSYLKEFGLHKLSDVLTSVCNRYLGTNCEDVVFSKVEDSICDDVICEFLSNGVIADGGKISRNFGNIYAQHKEKTKSKLSAFVSSINEIARNNFSLARYRVFLPLFWIYIPARYLVRCMMGKREKLSIGAFNITAERRKRIYKQLNLQD